MAKDKFSSVFFLLTASVIYLLGAYWIAFYLVRNEFETVILPIITLSLSALYFWKSKQTSFWVGILTGLMARVFLLLSLPRLSDDYFRFIWDGRLINASFNPLLHTPTQILSLNITGLDTALYTHLNSPDYYSVYPLVLQVQYFLATFLFPNDIIGAVVTMKAFFLLAEMASFYLIYKLLQKNNLDAKWSLVYWLHPLVLLEGMANLHAETWLVFFLVAMFLFLQHKKVIYSGVFLALAVSTKLYPIVFVPFVYFYLPKPQRLRFLISTALACLVLFFPLLIPILNGNLLSSVGLYFGQFEFNGSLYYIFKFIEKSFDKYAPPRIVSLLLLVPVFWALLKGVFYIKSTPKSNLPSVFLWFTLIYFLCNAVVHPWYLLPLLFYGVLTQKNWTVIWSFLILGTYIHYDTDDFTWMPYFVVVEYIVLALVLFGEEKKRVKLY